MQDPPSRPNMLEQIGHIGNFLRAPAEFIAALAAIGALIVSISTCAAQRDVSKDQQRVSNEQHRLAKNQERLAQAEAVPRVAFYYNPPAGEETRGSIVVENRELYSVRNAEITVHEERSIDSTIMTHIPVDLITPCTAYHFFYQPEHFIFKPVDSIEDVYRGARTWVLSYRDDLNNVWHTKEDSATKRLDAEIHIGVAPEAEWDEFKQNPLDSCE